MINRVLVSGFLWGDAASAYTTGGREKLVFDVAVEQSGGDGLCGWRAEVEDEGLIESLRGRLLRGCCVFIEGELAARRFERHGVQVGWSRFLRVSKCELPRSGGAELTLPASSCDGLVGLLSGVDNAGEVAS